DRRGARRAAGRGPHSPAASQDGAAPAQAVLTTSSDWDTACFYITPIGSEGDEQRKHADPFESMLVEPAMKELGLKVIRADKIGQPGMITSQTIEHLKRCRLVVADLSYLNPKVFYEMALRHACRLRIVPIIRKADKIPFDMNQVRCIIIDTSDMYTLYPKIDTYRAEIATKARNAIEDPEHNSSNPITVFYPDFWERSQSAASWPADRTRGAK